MEFSEYENIEIFINTQSFSINKCNNQLLEQVMQIVEKSGRNQTHVKTSPLNPN
jgi:hypothetical protein